MILYLEDDPTSRRTTSEILRKSGISVREASTYSEAVKLINQKVPSAIVIDKILPCGRNGLELVREPALRGKVNEITFIITSGVDISGDDITLPPHTYFLHKPFKPNQLVALLKREQVFA